jgi:DNA polymerase-3 subunit epsilon
MTNKSPIETAEFSVLDFETTGTSPRQSRVIEIGIVYIKNLQITDSYQTFINPGTLIPNYITSLTGITDNDVRNAPFFDEIILELLSFLGNSVIVAHNIPFDYNFLKNEFNRAGVKLPANKTLCTLKLARKLYPDLRSKSLSYLVKHFGIMHKNVHRALGDSMATSKLLIKMIAELQDKQNIKRVDELLAYQTVTPIKKNFKIIKKQLSIDLANTPEHPGVYIFRNSEKKAVYIGKAKILKRRVAGYFSNNATRKQKQIVRNSERLEFIATKSELTALILESELIKKENPPQNRLLKKYPQQYFIKINSTHRYPSVAIASKMDFDGNDYFGPYSNRETSKNLTDILQKSFMLRECSNKKLAAKKKCYLYDIKRCLAPCIFPENFMYKSELDAVYSFLSGNNDYVIKKLLGKMKIYAKEKRFENAAQIRNIINRILEQLNRTAIISEPINKANLLIRIDGEYNFDFLLLINGRLLIKDFQGEHGNLFEESINNYYNNSSEINENITEKDLGRIKITLGWLLNNKNKTKIFYLKDYSSAEVFFATVGL